jgi:hypothetical protein
MGRSNNVAAIIVALVAACEASGARAHDFWMQPDAYWLAPAVATPFTLQVGHGVDRQRSRIPLSRVIRFEAIGPSPGAVDLLPSMRLGGPTSDGTIAFRGPGTYVLVLQTDARAQSLLPAIRFNDYLRIEGLTPALRFRERMHRMAADGSEHYSRQAKAIIQVGTSSMPQSQVTSAIGLRLEIIPDVDPYASPRPTRLPVHVLYKGRPLPGGLIKLTDLGQDATPVESHLTDDQGRATFHAPGNGAWLLNVIWTEIAPPSSDSDFETVFSSLSFGFSAR